MTIETTLTLLIAAAILVGALVLRLVVMGLLRLGFWIAGRELPVLGIRRRTDPMAEALPRVPLLTRLDRFGDAVATVAMAVAATLAHWMRLTWRGLRAAYSWTRPKVVTGAKTTSHAVHDGTVKTVEWWKDTAYPYLKETEEIPPPVIDLREDEEDRIPWSDYRQSHSASAAPALGGSKKA